MSSAVYGRALFVVNLGVEVCGMRYPIGVQTFEKIIEGGFVYVDKTDLVYELAQQSVCFLSRPRRFGKSLLLSTLYAYFTGRRELFAGLRMESLETEWQVYPVFRVDFANGNYTEEDGLRNKLEACLCEWEQIYGKDDSKKEVGDRFTYVLQQAAIQTGHKAVVLVDEYDKPLLDALGEPAEQKNRELLRAFYGSFKTADEHLRFVMLTGVTKFSQITVFSGFNQPDDISLDRRYEAICGITEEELYQYFPEAIAEMADEYGQSTDDMKAILKKQYDGYHFSQNMLDIYNPFSLINAFSKKQIDSYWYRSGTPTYLAKLIDGHNINMQKLLSRPYESSYFVDYRLDAEDPLAMLYQAGYLTIKGYEPRYQEYYLDYPNTEVRKGFIVLVANGYYGQLEDRPDSWAVNLDKMLRQGDLDGIRDAFTAFLASIPYEANKNAKALDFETHFQYTFYLIMRMQSCYTTLIEKENSRGRADMIIESDRDVYIFEFKLDGTAAEALQQIEDRQYALPYLSDSRAVHRIGVNISRETRTVDDWAVD